MSRIWFQISPFIFWVHVLFFFYARWEQKTVSSIYPKWWLLHDFLNLKTVTLHIEPCLSTSTNRKKCDYIKKGNLVLYSFKPTRFRGYPRTTWCIQPLPIGGIHRKLNEYNRCSLNIDIHLWLTLSMKAKNGSTEQGMHNYRQRMPNERITRLTDFWGLIDEFVQFKCKGKLFEESHLYKYLK